MIRLGNQTIPNTKFAVTFTSYRNLLATCKHLAYFQRLFSRTAAYSLLYTPTTTVKLKTIVADQHATMGLYDQLATPLSHIIATPCPLPYYNEA